MIYAPNWSGDLIAVSGAMFGNVGISMPVDLGSGIPADAEARTTFLGGGRLQRKLNTRFSAVAILKRAKPGGILLDRAVKGHQPSTFEESWRRVTAEADKLTATGLLDDDERVPRIDVFTNPHAVLPLPEGVFVGPYDRTYAMIDNEYRFVAEGIALDGYYF